MTCQSGAITPKVGGALTPEIHSVQGHKTNYGALAQTTQRNE
jgi:hypothetical protein